RKLLAEVELQRHRPEQALQTATDPRGAGDPALLSIAGRASILEGDAAAGVTYFERGEQAAPSDRGRSLQVAAAYLAAHRNADALALLRKLEVPDTLADQRERLLLVALENSGRKAEMRSEAQRFAQARPKDLRALLIAASALQAAQEAPGARALLAQAAALDPKEPRPWVQLGWLEWSQHDPAAAQRAFAHALEVAPTNNAALLGAAQTDLVHGNTALAIARLEQVRALVPRSLAPRIGLARLYLSAGQLQKSAEALGEARALAPANPDVREIGGLLSLAQGEGAEAVAALEELARQFPKSPPVQADLARAYLLTGRGADARARAEAALKLDADYWPALLTELAVSVAAKDPKGADAALARLQHTSAPRATVLAISGEVAARAGRLADALQSFTDANAIAPSGPLAMRMFAVRRALHMTDPQAPLREWLQRSPSDVDVRVMLAEQLQWDGQKSAAMQEYETVLKQAPTQLVALNNLAWMKLAAGDAPAALDLARRAYASNNGQASVVDTYGWTLVQTGHAEDAVPLLRDAADRLPNNDDVRYHLGVALAKTGAVAEARRQLKAIADSPSQSTTREEARALLSSLDPGGKG
ncbi:MAG TPA: tetratricopeptide repeat protein, partial [Steroidobacteraceae bacterium]|nr:tetratricopeptide repeat protein [Steroidobacteraceae bacterium]